MFTAQYTRETQQRCERCSVAVAKTVVMYAVVNQFLSSLTEQSLRSCSLIIAIRKRWEIAKCLIFYKQKPIQRKMSKNVPSPRPAPRGVQSGALLFGGLFWQPMAGLHVDGHITLMADQWEGAIFRPLLAVLFLVVLFLGSVVCRINTQWVGSVSCCPSALQSLGLRLHFLECTCMKG